MIKITVDSYNNEAPLSPISAIFGEEQGTVGRSDDNFLVLPDPKHFVSRIQAKVWSNGDQHQLINLSLANPILINGTEIAAEQAHKIYAGDQIQIGLYILSVVSTEGAQVPANLPDPLPDVSELAKSADTKVSLPLPAKATPMTINPMANATKTLIQPPQFLLRAEATSVEAENVVTLQELPTSQTDASQPTQKQASAAATTDMQKPVADSADLLQAFLNGAGLPSLNLSSGLTPELMEILGKLVATSVQGTMGLIAQRALVKREVNAEVTMVVLRKNNPLKFFPDSQTVLTQMLRKKMPGFMAPAEAMEDAFLDLRAHQLGVVAGMKAAMESLLHKLHPAGFEKHLKAPSFLDSLNPARRKAEMWDHFSELFDRISLESKDEFQSLFGKEFLAAYENEVERVKHDSPDA
ncbi:FHA domain-containing protein [Undibacterium sp. GrIS 1.8]|uniref:type VI secretion system-associated FHA domain protein TagH n=1 Tax=unclassified Undibacterium TaxID=2630295 RepID=UPI003397036A